MVPARASRRPAPGWLFGLMVPPLAWWVALASGSEPEPPFEEAWSAVENQREQAAAAGFEWLETHSLLEEAMETFKQGKTDQAWQLLQRAGLQAERALEQARREKEAWQRRVIR